MNIAIFKEITTDDYLAELKEESEKYTGLYVDMNNAPERKYVKEKAELVSGLIKKLDRARIDKSKEYKQQVEKEAADIKEQLEIINSPFTLLIDGYKAERKKVLDAEKARKQAILDAEQLELDHELALFMNSTFEADRVKAIQEEREAEKARQIEREEYAAQQVKLAEERQIAQQRQAEQDRINEENARLANKEHCASLNRLALNNLIDSCELNPEQARSVVRAIIKNKISNVTINY
ncbi:MAG: hypothetical protein GY928_16580 [Colwellia sp.]|nr:hypothetical protein [Colwellia sp.]